jgi:hypothetical protein
MATSTILSNPQVKFGSVDLSGWCTSAELVRAFNPLSDTTFGDVAETSTAGLQQNELTVTLFMSYEASAVYATLAPLVGTKFNVTVKPTSAADGPTNPAFTLTNTFLPSLQVISASLGELQSIDINTTGGAYTVDITP